MEAGKRTLNDIFNGNRVLEIPFFQRAYVWKEAQWERLLADMKHVSKSKQPYFMGSVILKQQSTNSDNQVGDLRTLIDGQQRLTTLCIFFKVLYLKMNKNDLFSRSFTLPNDEFVLWHNHNDINSFEKILKLSELEDIDSGKREDSITDAYNYFRENIEIDTLDHQSIVNNLMFVGIDLGSEEDEQQIFDTINSLGVRLTTAELLKNYFFNRNDLNKYNKYWKYVFEKDEETKEYWDKEITTGRFKRTMIDLFFFYYLQIKIQQNDLNVSSEDKDNFSKLDLLFNSYKKLISKYNLNHNDLLSEIKDYAIIFNENIDPEIVNKKIKNSYGIERINNIIFGLETTTLLSYVLYILKNVEDEEVRNSIFGFLESYLMRRLVVKASTKNYNQFFTSLVQNESLTTNQLKQQIEKQKGQTTYFPSNDDLKEGFEKSILTNKQTKGIIYFLESMIRNEERQSTSLLGLKKYSLEHLMPKKWVNNWGNPEDNDIENRNKKLLTLGNLAIITQSLNASIRDSSWEIKKEGTEENSGLRQYSGGIETLSNYLDLDEWNEDAIESRAKDLYEKAKEIWYEE